MKTLTIGFSSPMAWKLGAEIIKWGQGNVPYSHVYLKVFSSYTNLNLIYQASHGFVNCIEYNNFISENKSIKEFTRQIEDDRLKDCIKQSQLMLQKPYGKLGLVKLGIYKALEKYFSIKIKISGDGIKTFHCSEFISRLFPDITQYSEEKNPDFIEPVDLYEVLDSGVI